MREEATPVSTPRFPKTQACQTDFTLLNNQSLVEEEEGGEEGRGRVWSWLLALVGSILVLLMLVLVVGVEYEGRLFRLLPYYPLRWVNTFFS